MTEDRLSSLAILYIHQEKEINVESVLDQFAQRKERRLALCLIKNDNCAIKRQTLLSACSRIHNQNNALFALSLLKLRARRFVLCLYSHKYFEKEIKKAVFFAQFTYVSWSYVLVRT